MGRPIPKQNAPELNVQLLSGERWDLSRQSPDSFTLLVFYRGLHCPLCKKYLQQLDTLLPEFSPRGVDVIAVSMDTEKRARLARQKWGIQNQQIGFGLSETDARHWGLFLSKGVKEGEPERFSEPGLFLINKDNTVYYAAINSNPWGRPYLPSFVKAVDYIVHSGYPARGEVL